MPKQALSGHSAAGVDRRWRRSWRRALTVALIAVILATGCTDGSDESDGDASASASDPYEDSAEARTTGWILRTYRHDGQEQRLVAAGAARRDQTGNIAAMDVRVVDADGEGRIAVNKSGTFVGVPAAGQSASSDGHHWVHFGPLASAGDT